MVGLVIQLIAESPVIDSDVSHPGGDCQKALPRVITCRFGIKEQHRAE